MAEKEKKKELAINVSSAADVEKYILMLVPYALKVLSKVIRGENLTKSNGIDSKDVLRSAMEVLEIALKKKGGNGSGENRTVEQLFEDCKTMLVPVEGEAGYKGAPGVNRESPKPDCDGNSTVPSEPGIDAGKA